MGLGRGAGWGGERVWFTETLSRDSKFFTVAAQGDGGGVCKKIC